MSGNGRRAFPWKAVPTGTWPVCSAQCEDIGMRKAFDKVTEGLKASPGAMVFSHAIDPDNPPVIVPS